MAGGRPKKDIDYVTVEKLASIMCTEQEISNYLDISVRTLQRDEEFCRVYKKGLDRGKISLRRQQFKIAERNAGMAIFLGKNYLDQSDRQEHAITGELEIDNNKNIEDLIKSIDKAKNANKSKVL